MDQLTHKPAVLTSNARRYGDSRRNAKAVPMTVVQEIEEHDANPFPGAPVQRNTNGCVRPIITIQLCQNT